MYNYVSSNCTAAENAKIKLNNWNRQHVGLTHEQTKLCGASFWFYGTLLYWMQIDFSSLLEYSENSLLVWMYQQKAERRFIAELGK